MEKNGSKRNISESLISGNITLSLIICSQSSCGKGTMKYYRSCDNPMPQHDYNGDKVKTVFNRVQECPRELLPVCIRTLVNCAYPIFLNSTE